MSRLVFSKAPRLFGVVLFLLFSNLLYAQQESISQVVITGKLPFSKEEAQQRIGNIEGQPFQPALAQFSAERLRRACMENYHPLAKVKWKAFPIPNKNQVILNLNVDLGPKGRLREIKFIGNTKFSDEQLLTVVKVLPREGFWKPLLRKDALKLDDLEQDRKNLEIVYQQAGYAAVQFGAAVLEPHPTLDGFKITWPVLQEGEVYGVGTIEFEAEVLPPLDVLEKLVPLRTDQKYNLVLIEQIRQNFQRYYYENGHAFVTVELVQKRLPAEKRVDITYKIQSGRRPQLRSILISGQDKTDRSIIENEISIAPGELFNPLEIEASKTRLDLLPMFTRVQMNIEGVPEAGVFDLRVQVLEKKTGRIEGGVLYGDAEGAAFQFNLLEKNLALKPPFRGGGLDAGLSATIGSTVTRGEVRLTNPRVGKSDWSLHGGIFYEDSENLSNYYNQESMGAQFLAGHPLNSYNLVSVGYSVLVNQLYDIDERALPDLSERDIDLRLTSLVALWDLNTTEEPLRPKQGQRSRVGLRIGNEALGGNVDVIQFDVKAGLYFNPYGDHVIQLKGGFGTVTPYSGAEEVPQSLKHYLGGSSNLRGFEYRSVSPLDEQGRALGGDTRWWATMEYLFPAIPDRLDLALYYDLGDVSSDDLSFSGEGPVSNVGIGIAVRADNFPIRFDFAMPLETYKNDQVNKKRDVTISFSAGYQF